MNKVVINNAKTSILLVCLGNICRSPSAHILLTKASDGLGWYIDSAATSADTIGLPPDERAVQVAHQLGLDMSTMQARQIGMDDFYRFDDIFAMDTYNLADLITLRTIAQQNAGDKKVANLALFDPMGIPVDDPYYEPQEAFDKMFRHLNDIIQRRFGLRAL